MDEKLPTLQIKMSFKKIFSIVFLLLFSFAVQAQSSDELFEKAREIGFNGKRKEARELCKQALFISPNYIDIRIFLGRLYTWDDLYDSARICFKKSIELNVNYIDAYSAWCDMELWSDNPNEALKIAKQGLIINPENDELLLKKSKALYNLKLYKEAYIEVNTILKKNKGSQEAFQLADRIKINLEKNKIFLGYDYDLFNKIFDPWQMGTLQYSRRTELIGTVVGRINYAERFKSTGAQYEIDAYPSLSKKMYAYVSAGISNDALFPQYRWGLSLYRSLPKSFEIEAGVRYLHFSNDTWIYTGSIGKYWKDFWFCLKPNFIPSGFGTSSSVNFITRYYLSDADNYLTLTLGTGISPDEVKIQRNDGTPNSVLLKSNRIRIGYQRALPKRFIISLGTGIAEEETSNFGYRTDYSFNIGLEKSF